MNRGWSVMRRSVLALFLREIRTRFGKYQLGYAWVLIEPIITVLVLVTIFTILGAPGYPGISFPVFLTTGVIFFSLFSDITNRSINAMEANSALLVYRPIRPIDAVLARALLELVVHFVVYATLLAAFMMLTRERMIIHDFPLLLATFVLLAVFSSSVGIIFMLLTDAYEDAAKVLPLITRPLFFISGVFFSAQKLPQDYWPILMWNPIFHAIELARSAVAKGYETPQASLGYLAASTLFVSTLSLVFYRRFERKLGLL